MTLIDENKEYDAVVFDVLKVSADEIAVSLSSYIILDYVIRKIKYIAFFDNVKRRHR